MRSKSFVYGLKKYLEFVPYYLTGSVFAFTVDLTIFTILRTSLGTNISAFISYIFGTITSFSILLILTKYRLNKKRFGFIIHLFIGLGTLIINLIVLNTIDYLTELYNYTLYTSILNKSNYYALITKTISSGLGFLWTSFMTGKFLFKKKY
tara:strand:- start:220 stop:672 length:453 start_codon:yes stop_codon:yes gene_type:complete